MSVPIARAEVVHRPAPEESSCSAPQPAIVVPPVLNAIVPVGFGTGLETRAVKVTAFVTRLPLDGDAVSSTVGVAFPTG